MLASRPVLQPQQHAKPFTHEGPDWGARCGGPSVMKILLKMMPLRCMTLIGMLVKLGCKILNALLA